MRRNRREGLEGEMTIVTNEMSVDDEMLCFVPGRDVSTLHKVVAATIQLIESFGKLSFAQQIIR